MHDSRCIYLRVPMFNSAKNSYFGLAAGKGLKIKIPPPVGWMNPRKKKSIELETVLFQRSQVISPGEEIFFEKRRSRQKQDFCPMFNFCSHTQEIN